LILGKDMPERTKKFNAEKTSCEKTLIITDEGVKIMSSEMDNVHEQTYRDTSAKLFSETEYQLLGMTELEKKQYYKTIKRADGNKYKIQGVLVSGGMGAILKAIDQDLQRPTAMKVVLPSFKNDQHALDEFIKEAKITGMLEHPNIMPVHELGLTDETGLFFTMKLVQGESLHHIIMEIKKGVPQYVEKFNMFHLLYIFRRICDAIAFAHSKDIIHQDIKPHNVIVGQYGEVLVMDWGLAKFIGNAERETDTIRREILRSISVYTSGKKHIIQGSPAYMSPEQVKGDNSLLDRQTDIFLLGTTLYHIFTLESPYKGENIQEVLKKAEHRDLTPPQVRNPERQIPEEICRIIMKAAALKKTDRYRNIQELIADVDDVIAGKWSRQDKKIFARGQYLMEEGENAEEAYLITKGKVRVFKEIGGNKVILSTLHEGDIVGEMALITDAKRSASVQALEDTEVAVLNKEVLAHNLKKLPPYIEKMVSTITRRLQAANAFIHPHLTSDCTPFVLQQLGLILKTQSGVKRKFVVPFDEIGARISEDLGIPVARVEKVFLNAAEANLLSIKGNQIIIEEINKILYSANLAKNLVNK
jgi:serine/threonine-protein kinase